LREAGIGLDVAGMTRIGLTLNEAKTSIRQARQQRFDFLG
jgi:RNA-directed DNA polymerase